MPGCEQHEKITVRPSFNHPPWRHSRVRGAHWRPLSVIVWFDSGSLVQSFKCSLSLSLSMEEGICLPLEVWQESWPNFR